MLKRNDAVVSPSAQLTIDIFAAHAGKAAKLALA